MIPIETFVSIEQSLTQRLWLAFMAEAEALMRVVESYLQAGEFDKAAEAINKLDLTNAVEYNRGQIAWVTNLAMLFGASRVTARPGTSVVGLGHEKTAATQAADGFAQMLVNRGGLWLRAQALQLIALRRDVLLPKEEAVFKADAPSVKSFDPNQRVLLPFDSFMDKSGRAFFNMASSLHTSRLSAYGFTAEAYALGLQYYQINEQLDNRICPVCRVMHGKRFKVEDARRLLDVVLRVSDTEDLKSLQPWPSQSKDSVEELSSLSQEQLVARGWHIPPYHPRCRGLLTRVGKAPTLQQIDEATIPPEDAYTATQADFSALGYQATPDQVDAWNKASNVAPAQVAAAMQGKPLDAYLEGLFTADDPLAASGVTQLKFDPAKGAATVQTEGPSFGSSGAVTTKVTLNSLKSMLTLDRQVLASADDDPVDILRKTMQSLYTVTQDANLTYLSAPAKGAAGFKLAQAGFVPDYAGWEAMKKDLSSSNWYDALPSAKKAMLTEILASDSPLSVYDLAKLGALGKQALSELVWQAYLNITDEDAMARFLTYFGG